LQFPFPVLGISRESPRILTVVENYTLGIKEQIIFPEIDIDKIVKGDGYGDHICLLQLKKTKRLMLSFVEFGFTF
jgi:ribosomal protein L5